MMLSYGEVTEQCCMIIHKKNRRQSTFKCEKKKNHNKLTWDLNHDSDRMSSHLSFMSKSDLSIVFFF